MEFGRDKKRRRNNVKTEYVTSLQLYKMPPVETISLQEFEELAEQRLKRKTTLHVHVPFVCVVETLSSFP